MVSSDRKYFPFKEPYRGRTFLVTRWGFPYDFVPEVFSGQGNSPKKKVTLSTGDGLPYDFGPRVFYG